MRIIVTGATGLLGRQVMTALHDTYGDSVTGIARSRTGKNIANFDLLDAGKTELFLRREMPQIIIHLAAERRPDQFERNQKKSRILNVDTVAGIAAVAREIDAWMLYLSTDYVFDGTSAPYTPGDAPNPLNAYGRSKYEGELALWGATTRAAVLRVPLLVGPSSSIEESPVTMLLKNLDAGGEIDHWQQRYPTYTPDVAAVISRMVELSRDDPYFAGTFHWSGNEVFTKYDMIRIMARMVGKDATGLTPRRTPGEGASRPFDTRLDCSALEERGCSRRTPFKEAVHATLVSIYGKDAIKS